MAQYAHIEWSYDQYHKHRDELYRVTLDQYLNGELLHSSAENYPALGPALERDFPEVVRYTRLYNLGAKNNIAVTREDTPDKITFKHRKLLYASEDFLNMFSYPLIAGGYDALAEPFKMVISEEYAQKYFGNENPIGMQLRMQDDDFNNELCEVTAVVQVPENSHLKFDVLISYSTLFSRYNGSDRARERYDQSWDRKDMYTYVQLQPGSDPLDLETSLPGVVDQYMPDLAAQNRQEIMHVQPITDIHLHSDLNNEPEYNGNGRAVTFLSMIALFVLLLAYINYINLATARSVERANEVGVRKVLGARPAQLVRQFLFESFLVNLVAVLISVAAFLLLFPAFSQLTGILTEGDYWNYLIVLEPWFLLFLAGLVLMGTLFSGLYPAFVLSNFKPIRILGKSLQSDRQGVLLRKMLVVLQFSICIALIIGTLTVLRQMRFLQQQDLGFNASQIVVVEQPSMFSDFESRTNQIRVFKESLRKESQISDVMSTLVIPGQKVRWKSDVRRRGQSEDQAQIFNYNLVDEHFFDGFEMDMVAGRNFSPDIPSDRDTACVITESGAKVLGFDNPLDAVGQVLQSDNSSSIVIGVVNDYHQESLHSDVHPTIFFVHDYAEYYLMRIGTDQVSGGIAAIESNWNTHFPGSPFQYFFMDDHFNAQYENDLRFQKLFMVFAVLSIILACLGLFGLSAYTAQQRLREISIRKVLGARIDQVVLLLSKDFAFLILIGNLIAWPIIAWAMQRWLESFAVRTSLSIWVFIFSAGLVISIGALTVAYHAIRAALVNPSEILATE